MEEKENVNRFDSVPEELIQLIISNLSKEDLLQLRLVNHAFQQIVNFLLARKLNINFPLAKQFEKYFPYLYSEVVSKAKMDFKEQNKNAEKEIQINKDAEQDFIDSVLVKEYLELWRKLRPGVKELLNIIATGDIKKIIKALLEKYYALSNSELKRIYLLLGSRTEDSREEMLSELPTLLQEKLKNAVLPQDKCEISEICLTVYLVLYDKNLIYAGEKSDEIFYHDSNRGSVTLEFILDCTRHNRLALVKFLFENGYVGKETVGQNGNSVLHVVAAQGTVEMVKLCLGYGIDINIKNQSLATPLHAAVSAENIKMIECLLQQGADVNLRNSKNYTIWDYFAPEYKELIREEYMKYKKQGGNLSILSIFNNNSSNTSVTTMPQSEDNDNRQRVSYGRPGCRFY